MELRDQVGTGRRENGIAGKRRRIKVLNLNQCMIWEEAREVLTQQPTIQLKCPLITSGDQ